MVPIYLLGVFECVHVKQKNSPGYKHPTFFHFSFSGLHHSLKNYTVEFVELKQRKNKNRILIQLIFQTEYQNIETGVDTSST